MRKVIGILSLLFLSITINGQNKLSLQNILGSKSYMIDATKNGFVLVKQDYVLKGKNGDLYGRDGNSFYGENFYVGLLLNDSLYVKSKVEPWKEDADFLKENDSLKPKISKISYRTVNDTISEFIDVKDTSNINKKGVNLFSIGKTNSFLISDFDENNEDIFLIYFKSTDSILSQKSSIELRRENFKDIYNQEKKSLYQDNLNKDMLGGAFFIPVISLGKIEYKVVAILDNDGGNWKLTSIKSKQPLNSGTNKITPIN